MEEIGMSQAWVWLMERCNMLDFAEKSEEWRPLGGPRLEWRVLLNRSANYVIRVYVSSLKLLHVFSAYLRATEMLQ